MKTLYLLRHGATDWNATGQLNSTTDLDLSDRGRQDILALVPRIQTLRLNQVFCSPRRRALRTAELLGFGATVTIDDRLRELDFGCFEGKRPRNWPKIQPSRCGTGKKIRSCRPVLNPLRPWPIGRGHF